MVIAKTSLIDRGYDCHPLSHFKHCRTVTSPMSWKPFLDT